MTIKECYDMIGGDYEECLGRLMSDKLVTKFAGKFLDDGSFRLLEDSIAAHDAETAFRAAHTLKGVCQNLSYTKLYESSHTITEALRPGSDTPEEVIAAMLGDVRADYERTAGAIRDFLAQG